MVTSDFAVLGPRSDVLRPQRPDPHLAALGALNCGHSVKEGKNCREKTSCSAARTILFPSPDSRYREPRGAPHSSSVSALSCLSLSYPSEYAVGYSVFAFNQTIYKKLDPKTHQNLAQTLIGRLKRRPGVVFLKRISIVLDEDSEKGFGLVSYRADYLFPPLRAYAFTLSPGEHELIDFFRLRYYCINTDHSWHLINSMPDTQSALRVNRTCHNASSDSPPFAIPFETHACSNSHKKRCSVRDELLWCIR